MDPHRLGELRSLAYHRAVAARLRADPSLRAEARTTLERWLPEFPRSRRYLDEWSMLLEGPIDDLLTVLEADTEPARTLRSCSPFAGVLDPRERWRIWREVAEAHRDP